MDANYSRIDITNDLRIKYRDYLQPEIITISIIQSNDDVWLETLSIIIIKEKGWTKETINRINLDFITKDVENDDVISMFNPADNIEVNAIKFINELSPYSLINTTDLFTDKACDIINKRYNVFGIDK
ncbi:MAG: hypothetical protein AB9835_02050 [Eubacteriales bacterium]